VKSLDEHLNKLILMQYFLMNCSVGPNTLHDLKSDQYFVPHKIKADLFEEGRTFSEKILRLFLIAYLL
jgi:hypothetical protein